jgi:hypothetical protein
MLLDRVLMQSPLHLLRASFAAALLAFSPLFATSIVLQPGPEGHDAEIDNGLPNQNWGGLSDLVINWFGGARSVGLISFDLSAVPSGATINDASLSLFHRVNNNNGQTYQIFRVTSSWAESTVTWNTQPTFDPVAVASLTIGDTSSGLYRSWDITALVQGWVSGTYQNYGMWIEEVPIQGSGTAFFESSDGQADRRPILDITYDAVGVPDTGSSLGLVLSGFLFVGFAARRCSRRA